MTDVRKSVAQAYEKALQRSQDASGGCCGSTAPSVTVEQALYGEEAQAYGEAKDSSFGCGNPLAFAGVQPGQTVLDLGSGAGLDLLIAADKVGPTGKVLGVDMTDAMLDAARKTAAAAGKTNIEVRKGFIEELPVDDASVDWVISNCVINLSPDKDAVFREVARVLKPGGRFSISDMVVDELPDAVRNAAGDCRSCISGALAETDYVAGLLRSGMSEVEVTERIVYTAAQLQAILGEELGLETGAEDVAAAEGHVWSAKFTGTK